MSKNRKSSRRNKKKSSRSSSGASTPLLSAWRALANAQARLDDVEEDGPAQEVWLDKASDANFRFDSLVYDLWSEGRLASALDQFSRRANDHDDVLRALEAVGQAHRFLSFSATRSDGQEVDVRVGLFAIPLSGDASVLDSFSLNDLARLPRAAGLVSDNSNVAALAVLPLPAAIDLNLNPQLQWDLASSFAQNSGMAISGPLAEVLRSTDEDDTQGQNEDDARGRILYGDPVSDDSNAVEMVLAHRVVVMAVYAIDEDEALPVLGELDETVCFDEQIRGWSEASSTLPGNTIVHAPCSISEAVRCCAADHVTIPLTLQRQFQRKDAGCADWDDPTPMNELVFRINGADVPLTVYARFDDGREIELADAVPYPLLPFLLDSDVDSSLEYPLEIIGPRDRLRWPSDVDAQSRPLAPVASNVVPFVPRAGRIH